MVTYFIRHPLQLPVPLPYPHVLRGGLCKGSCRLGGSSGAYPCPRLQGKRNTSSLSTRGSTKDWHSQRWPPRECAQDRMQEAWETQPLASRALPHLRQVALGYQGGATWKRIVLHAHFLLAQWRQRWRVAVKPHKPGFIPNHWRAGRLDGLGSQKDAKCTERALQFST